MSWLDVVDNVEGTWLLKSQPVVVNSCTRWSCWLVEESRLQKFRTLIGRGVTGGCNWLERLCRRVSLAFDEGVKPLWSLGAIVGIGRHPVAGS